MNAFGLQLNFWLYWFIFCGIIMSCYFMTASGAYYLLTLVKDKGSVKLPATARQQRRAAILGDIKLSILSVIFFAFCAACFMVCYNWGLTQAYTQFRIQDLGYIACSYAVVLLLQDAYFYFTHRLFHLPLLFKPFHRGHHLSKPPTPWTFFALEPMEAASQAFFLLGITFVVPLHFGVLLAVLLTMTIWSTGNHLGCPIVPASRQSRWLGKWFIGSTYHLVHHRQYTKHYGLYFTFWDQIMGTQKMNDRTEFLQQ